MLPCDNPTKSFWIEAAESPLRNHRSTEKLPEQCDVLIIGSGYTGASAAYWINKFSAKGKTPSMVMLEARDVCGGATGRNGGQLRPHTYSRYPPWKSRFGADGAHELILHEVAHLDVFPKLLDSEGITKEVCFKAGTTFDAAMSQEAWDRLRGAYEDMKADHGEDDVLVKQCRLIPDSQEAEEISQMKGAMAAVVHPTGQIWPYKFVHALLRIVMETGRLNLQANTPAQSVSDRDADGLVTVTTARGSIKAKTVLHATNRWAGHLLGEFEKLIQPGRATLAALKAPEGFIKHTGSQHWDSVVNNYHLQLPPPYNHIIVGGAKPLTVFNPTSWIGSAAEDQQFAGVPDFYRAWPERDVLGWKGKGEFDRADDEGGVWSGIYGCSVDSFPFVGPVPSRAGHFVAAGFTGHGMPRILLSTAYITPLILSELGIPYSTPDMVKDVPPLPKPFHVTQERVDRLQDTDLEAYYAAQIKDALASSHKEFCRQFESVGLA